MSATVPIEKHRALLRRFEEVSGTLRFVACALPVLRTMCQAAKLTRGAAKAQEMINAVDEALMVAAPPRQNPKG